MATLIIPVERLREGPLKLELDLPPEALDLRDEQYQFTGHVRGDVVFHLIGEDVLASGEIHAQVTSICVRCLAPAEATIHVTVNEAWIENRPEEEQADREFSEDAPLTRTYAGDEIELDEVFRELILSELPDRVYCQPECKGLCPGCGANLNLEPCRCLKEEAAEIIPLSGPLPEWKKTLKNLKLEP